MPCFSLSLLESSISYVSVPSIFRKIMLSSDGSLAPSQPYRSFSKYSHLIQAIYGVRGWDTMGLCDIGLLFLKIHYLIQERIPTNRGNTPFLPC